MENNLEQKMIGEQGRAALCEHAAVLETLLAEIEAAYSPLEGYDRVSFGMCTRVSTPLNAFRDRLKSYEQVLVASHPFPLVLMAHWIDLDDCTDSVQLFLAAYAEVCLSMTIKDLRIRHGLHTSMRHFVRSAQTLLQSLPVLLDGVQKELQHQRPPSCLRIVTDDATEEESKR